MEEQLLAMVEMELNKDNDCQEENVYEVCVHSLPINFD